MFLNRYRFKDAHFFLYDAEKNDTLLIEIQLHRGFFLFIIIINYSDDRCFFAQNVKKV